MHQRNDAVGSIKSPLTPGTHTPNDHWTPGSLHLIDPLEDSRWDNFVRGHSESSVFHTTGWLEALRRTYGYRPVAITTSDSKKPLRTAWVFCAIDSSITGRRWVSLPFSDHCQPLIGAGVSDDISLSTLAAVLATERLRYFELRTRQSEEFSLTRLPLGLLSSTRNYCFHSIDLSPNLQTLFRNCHKDSTQRKIQRSIREQLVYEEGTSDELIDAFFRLQVITRVRQGIPPQPKKWFQNVLACLGNGATISVAYKGRHPVAAILTLAYKDTMTYKYGCSDAVYHNLGSMHLLIWKTIEKAKQAGLRIIDMGRTDPANTGLIAFKDRWGSQSSILHYARFTSARSPKDLYSAVPQSHGQILLGRLISHLPCAIVRAVGERVYKHLG